MEFRRGRRIFGIMMWVILLGVLLQVKGASASTCYNHDDKRVVTKAATCGKNGYREYHCSKCGKLIRTETIYATGNHNWSSWSTTQSATCTSSGSKTRKCNTCGKTESGTLSALGHSVSGQKKTVAATCTSAGYTAIICNRCGAEVSRSTIAAKGHSWGGWTTDKAATCEAGGTKHRNCTVCGARENGTMSALGHSVSGQTKTVAATCTAAGYTAIICNRCGKEVSRSTIAAKGHSWGSWTTDKAATCEATGTKHRNCTVCGTRENGTISALGHNVTGQKKTVNATCTTAGYTAIICNRCGKEVSKTTIPAKGHTWGNWITDKAPTGCNGTGSKHRVCSVCGTRETATIIGEGHKVSGEKKTVPATCGKDGYTVVICSRCGQEMGSRTVIPATGSHTWGAWVIEKQPTCDVNGVQSRTCSVCGKVEKKVIIGDGHGRNPYTKTVEATCGADGYTVKVCRYCGKEVGSRTVIPATGKHTWGSWIVDKKATCETTGTRHHVCSVCGKSVSETIKALGHNVQGQLKTVAATCSTDGYSVVTCSRCGKEMGNRTVIKATGKHTWGSWIVDKKATCEATGTRHHVCSVCGKSASETIKALGHNVQGQLKTVAATCGKDGYSVVVCSRCGKEMGNRTVIKATGKHTWGSWVTDKKATCEASGTRHHVCSVCGKKESETIKPLGHNVQGQIKRVAPTCEKDGYAVVTCSRCGKEMGSKTVIPATGHTWGSWVIDKKETCTAEGLRHHVCTVCNKRVSEAIKKKNHNVQGQIKRVEPTCVKDGYAVVVCSDCGQEMGNRTVLKATGKHTWGAWVIDKQATCETEGKRHHVCTVCGKTETQVLPKLGHNVQGQIKRVAATCVKDGYSVVVCSRCGKEMGNRTVIKGKHTWGSWIVDQAATYSTTGSMHRVCTVCGTTEKQTIPKLSPLISTEQYSADGNLIYDVYGTIDYNGAPVQYRQITIVPQTSDHMGGSDSWEFSKDDILAEKLLVQFTGIDDDYYAYTPVTVDDGWRTVRINGEMSIYDAFCDADGIPSGFNTSSKFTNLIARVSIDYRLTYGFVFFYVDSTKEWQLVYRGSQIVIDWDVSASGLVYGTLVSTNKSGVSRSDAMTPDLKSLYETYIVNPGMYSARDAAIDRIYLTSKAPLEDVNSVAHTSHPGTDPTWYGARKFK